MWAHSLPAGNVAPSEQWGFASPQDMGGWIRHPKLPQVRWLLSIDRSRQSYLWPVLTEKPRALNALRYHTAASAFLHDRRNLGSSALRETLTQPPGRTELQQKTLYSLTGTISGRRVRSRVCFFADLISHKKTGFQSMEPRLYFWAAW